MYHHVLCVNMSNSPPLFSFLFFFFLLSPLHVTPSPFIPSPPPSPPPPPTPNVTRPQLIGSELIQAERVVGNEEYKYTQMTLKFDQPLYLNEALLCAEADSSCSPKNCVPCDWTGHVEVPALSLSLFFFSFPLHPFFFFLYSMSFPYFT